MENEIFDPFEEPKDPRREGKKESRNGEDRPSKVRRPSERKN